MSAASVLEVAQRFGARLKRVTSTEWAGPCPKCGGRDRFGVNTARDLWNCRGCGRGGDVIALVQHVLGMSYREALAYLGDPRACEADSHRLPIAREAACASETITNRADPEKVADALALWRDGIDPGETAVERYLRLRGLVLDAYLAGRVLRWHAGVGAMLALFRNIHTGEPQAISRTFLSPSGQKIERKFLGPVGGAAIMLDAFDAVTGGLNICEGIETAQAARQLGLRPTWALGSAGAIAAFPVVGGIEALTICAEHDQASARATEACAARWAAAGREVLINHANGGKDLADVIRGVA